MLRNTLGSGLGYLGLIVLLVPNSFGATTLFRPVRAYNTGPSDTIAIAVAVADVNGDSKPDILVGLRGADDSGSVSVLLGNGDGMFQAAVPYSTSGHMPRSIAVGDLNGDSKPDLLVAQDEGVAVLLGNGDGTFHLAPDSPIETTSPSFFATMSDINGDDKLDALIVVQCILAIPECPTGTGAGVFLGKGDGTFGTLHTYASGDNSASSIAVGDLNHDGKLDLVVDNISVTLSAIKNHGSVATLLGNGDGTFQAPRTFDKGGFNGGAVAIADVNMDGNPDVIAANTCANDNCELTTTGVLLGNGDGTLQKVKIRGTGGWQANGVAVADINRDGFPDILVSNVCEPRQVCDNAVVGLLLGNGDGTFTTAKGYSSGGQQANGIAVADANGDGVPDVFVSNTLASDFRQGGSVGVLLSLFPTTTFLSSSRSSTTYGRPITLKATIASEGPISPTGTVLFQNGTSVVGSANLNDGIATLTKTNVPAGILSLTATYKGDALSAKSKSAPISQTVWRATSTTTIQSSLNPSFQGQPVKFTATVSSPTAKVSGIVTFSAGSTVLGTATLDSGKASITTSILPQGDVPITATYEGTPNILKSKVFLIQVVN